MSESFLIVQKTLWGNRRENVGLYHHFLFQKCFEKKKKHLFEGLENPVLFRDG